MSSESLTNDSWAVTLDRLGGRELLEREARKTGAFQRAREVACAVDCLQLTLAYCLGAVGLRLTAARFEATGLVSLSNVALLKRVRKSVRWLEVLVARLIATRSAQAAPIAAAHGRLVRLVDGSTVNKKGLKDKADGGCYRVHAVLDLPTERFSAFELTDEKGAEQFDRAAVIAGEIRIGDRYYLQPDRIANVLAGGGDIIVRARWNAVRWLDAEGGKLELVAILKKARGRGLVDQPIQVARDGGEPLALRLVAMRRPEAERTAAVAAARRKAQKNGATIRPETVLAAEWMILVTSLPQETFSLHDISALYRLRWRIEIAFKHLKSGAGLDHPPATTEATAKATILAHLLLILLTEPLLADHLGDSPRREAA